ncbi:MAG TPA: SagB family peptide dehydrogenase, partial [Phormidium sp.]
MAIARLSIAQHYHERTKYDPKTIATKSQGLDWSSQPVPFKEYRLGTSFDLKPYLTEKSEITTNSSEDNWWRRLSSLLFCSYGLTAKMLTITGESVYLRAAPSAGGLYPAEVYLISRGTPLLPAGLYNYQPKTHSLIQFWENQVWTGLQEACFWHPVLNNTQLAIVTTAIFYRSAWRYQDRAYRRIYLDTGHLLGNLELAGALTDYRPHLIGGFSDRAVNEILYLDSEQEGTITVIPLADLLDTKQNLPLAQTTLPSKTQTDYPKIPDGELLKYFHEATEISAEPEKTEVTNQPSLEDKYNFPFCLKVSTATEAINWGENLESLENTIFQRRSTRAYNGANLTLNELKSLLNFTYQPSHYIDQNLDTTPDYFDLSLIETFIAVSGVDGLEEGCYYYAPKAQELRQIRFKNFRRELYYLCLQHELGRGAAAVLFH